MQIFFHLLNFSLHSSPNQSDGNFQKRKIADKHFDCIFHKYLLCLRYYINKSLIYSWTILSLSAEKTQLGCQKLCAKLNITTKQFWVDRNSFSLEHPDSRWLWTEKLEIHQRRLIHPQIWILMAHIIGFIYEYFI